MAKKLAFAIIAITIPLLLTGCGLKKQEKRIVRTSPTPTASSTSTDGDDSTDAVNENSYLGIEPSSVDATVTTNKENADKKAKLWKADAALVHYSVKLPGDFSLNNAVETYTYGSASDAYNWWTIVFSGKTGKSVRALIPKEDYLGTTLQPIDTKFWKSNFVNALQLAEVNGGSDYRDNHEAVETSINLSVGQPKNFLWWKVDYSSSSGTPLEVLINPSTKEVFAASGSSPSPAISPKTTKSPISSSTKSPSPSASISNDDDIEEEVLP